MAARIPVALGLAITSIACAWVVMPLRGSVAIIASRPGIAVISKTAAGRPLAF